MKSPKPGGNEIWGVRTEEDGGEEKECERQFGAGLGVHEGTTNLQGLMGWRSPSWEGLCWFQKIQGPAVSTKPNGSSSMLSKLLVVTRTSKTFVIWDNRVRGHTCPLNNA